MSRSEFKFFNDGFILGHTVDDKMNHLLFERKYLLGCAEKLGHVSKQLQVREQQHITFSTQCFVSFCFFSSSVLFSLVGYTQKPFDFVG